MEPGHIIGILKESIFAILVFCAFLFFAMARGKHFVINLILSLYLALLISLKFPYYDVFRTGADPVGPLTMVILFLAFTILALFLFGRINPKDEFDSAFQQLWKKIVYALAGTVLIMAFSYHALPVTELITHCGTLRAT
jgi:hypothetical protein